MDSLSNDLSRRLIKNNVKRGDIVALYMDKSIEMFLSILAIHKAGGAYVPLDPEFPAERINMIINLSQATLVLTTQGHHDQFTSKVGSRVDSITVDFRELSPATKPDVGVKR